MNVLTVLFAVIYTNFFYCTQYYRAPTPLPNEWEQDMQALTDNNIPTIVLRVHWRNNERREGEYDFKDLDRLFDLAEKYDKQIAIEVMLECAPQYIFDKYDGSRVDHRGGKGLQASIGAFYTGGWLPCFQNPKVAERAALFTEKLAERYGHRKAMTLWNAWNEPRTRPCDECFCKHCRKGYGDWMKARFGTIDKLNDFFGTCEESFENIALPGGASGHWDIFSFKSYKAGKCIYDNLKFVYDAIRKYDQVHPVISHAGATSGFQLQIHDLINDYEVVKAVDGWGTSLPMYSNMRCDYNRIHFNMLCDYLRCIDPNFVIFEIYPGLGSFGGEYDDYFDFYYKLATGIGAGTKGLNFWQFRSERLGNEDDCAGLVRMDGTPRPALGAVKDIGATVKQIKGEICSYYPAKSEIAILFDYSSLLMSTIVDGESSFDFAKIDENSMLYYTLAHQGWYHMLKASDYAVDYLSTTKLDELGKYKVVIIPSCSMFPRAAEAKLAEYVRNGGTVILDESFGMRDENTWMNPYDIKCGGIMKARLAERRQGPGVLKIGKEGAGTGRNLVFDGDPLETAGFVSWYNVQNAKTLISFEDGKPAAQEVAYGKGKAILNGFALGYLQRYHEVKKDAEAMKRCVEIFEAMVKGIKLAKPVYGKFAEGLEERRLYRGNEAFLYLMNFSEKDREIILSEKVVAMYLDGELDAQTLKLPAKKAILIKYINR